MKRLPSILFWVFFLAVLLLIGPIAYAVVSLDSRPGGGGADWEAKLLVALLVLLLAGVAGLIARALARLALRLRGRS